MVFCWYVGDESFHFVEMDVKQADNPKGKEFLRMLVLNPQFHPGDCNVSALKGFLETTNLQMSNSFWKAVSVSVMKFAVEFGGVFPHFSGLQNPWLHLKCRSVAEYKIRMDRLFEEKGEAHYFPPSKLLTYYRNGGSGVYL